MGYWGDEPPTSGTAGRPDQQRLRQVVSRRPDARCRPSRPYSAHRISPRCRIRGYRTGDVVDHEGCARRSGSERTTLLSCACVQHRCRPCDPGAAHNVTAAIGNIVADGFSTSILSDSGPKRTLDDGIGDGHTSFYFGAAGMIWRIDYLARVGATNPRFDFRPFLPALMEANRAKLPNYEDYAK